MAARLTKGRRSFRFPEDFRTTPVILPSLESDVRSGFDLTLNRAGIRPIIAAEVDDPAILRVLAMQLKAVALVPKVIVQAELRSGSFVARYPSRFYAITPSRTFLNPLVKELIAHATEKAEERCMSGDLRAERGEYVRLKNMVDSSNVLPGPARGHLLALGGFLAVTFLVAGVSTAFTAPAIPTWYTALAKPAFNPPSGIFGPVWTLLYCLMAVAAWLIWKRPSSHLRSSALLLYCVQLALNFAWSLIFFGQRLIGVGLIDIVLLWLAIAFTSVLFFRLSKAAGWMFVPYLAWVSFAGVLNFEIWQLN